jgi:hypothetical protein
MTVELCTPKMRTEHHPVSATRRARTAHMRSWPSRHRSPVLFAAQRTRGASFCAVANRPHCLLLITASMSSRSWLASGTVALDGSRARPFRRVISRLPATLHDGIREQIDRPSTLVTDWLNLHTPVGREYVGHRRVDHERRVCPPKDRPRSTSPRPVPIAGYGASSSVAGCRRYVRLSGAQGDYFNAGVCTGEGRHRSPALSPSFAQSDVRSSIPQAKCDVRWPGRPIERW